MKNSKCIIAISHSDYLYRNAGTEKCMREIACVLKKNEIHYFQIFSFEENSRLQHLSNMNGKVGINYDKKFLGIYLYKDIPNVMNMVQKKYKVNFIGVHIHNVLNHDYDYLKDYLQSISLPILIWIHDYTSICPESPILLKNRSICCKNFEGNFKVCDDCCYKSLAAISQKKIKFFYEEIDDMIWGVIAPSINVKNNILIAYPNWNDRIHIRGHLKFDTKCKKNKLKFPLRIAYVGGEFEHKGISEWEKLYESFKNSSNYEFYYLGASKVKREAVTSVYVDASIQGNKAMSLAAKKYKIDIAFLWSKCQETYSYTYYEMRSVGAQVITYNQSGNIVESVIKENSGLVFENIDELIYLMKRPKEFIKKLECCTDYYYSNYEINEDISLLISPKSCVNNHEIYHEIHNAHKFRILSCIHMSCNIYKKIKERLR